MDIIPIGLQDFFQCSVDTCPALFRDLTDQGSEPVITAQLAIIA